MVEEAKLTVLVCQRCGSGFLLTSTYLEWLARHGLQVVQPVSCPTCMIKYGPSHKVSGKVKWFRANKHYGFIESDSGGDVFFQRQQIINLNSHAPTKGTRVRFHVHDTWRGPEALNVELLEDPTSHDRKDSQESATVPDTGH